MVEGRSEITQILKRRRYHESTESELRKKKIKKSQLSMKYHIYDCVGKTLISRQAAVGMPGKSNIIRLIDR